MDLDDKEKINVLMNLLNERYNASHKMRERSFKFALWIFGILIGGGSWLLLNGSTLTTVQKVQLTIIILLTGVFTFWFIHAIKKGFDTNWALMVRIEKSIGCYKKGVFIKAESLFPDPYKEPKKTFLSSHFLTLYAWLISTVTVIVFMIWCPNFIDGKQSQSETSVIEKDKDSSIIIINDIDE